MGDIEHSDEWRAENETDGALELWKQRATERRIAYAKLAEEHKTLVAQHAGAVEALEQIDALPADGFDRGCNSAAARIAQAALDAIRGR